MIQVARFLLIGNIFMLVGVEMIRGNKICRGALQLVFQSSYSCSLCY